VNECDKVKFKTEKAALKYVRQGSKNLKSKAGRMRAYLCEVCRFFHLTSYRNKTHLNYRRKKVETKKRET
jgi:CRISPR-associated protein Cas8b1/Cst1 subtype I-B